MVPAGYRVGLSVRGTDYEFEGAEEAAELSHFKGSKMRGVGIYTHADPVHRPADIFGGITTVHAGPDHPVRAPAARRSRRARRATRT